MNMAYKLKNQLLLIVVCSFLQSCTAINKVVTSDGLNADELTASQRLQISIPLPDESSYVKEKTVIFGEGERFSGSLFLLHKQNIDEIVQFYRTNMRNDGWDEIAIFRSNFILINFNKDDRFSTIKINPRIFNTSSSEVTVGPKTSAEEDSFDESLTE